MQAVGEIDAVINSNDRTFRSADKVASCFVDEIRKCALMQHRRAKGCTALSLSLC